MEKVTIHNIGPIKDVELDLNKVNVFMGPQSSGKSTIAKIISYCQWVEKRCLLDGAYNYDFSDQFMNFHRIDDNYFSADSSFQYESDFISITYKYGEDKEQIQKKETDSFYKKSKNIYIPAERNFVSVVPNLGKYKETNDNIMSFLYDWYDAKRKYAKKDMLPILNLGVNFHHLEENDADILTLSKAEKEISLRKASSGLQSIVPLAILIDYLIRVFYKEKHTPSVNERKHAKLASEEFKKNKKHSKVQGEKIAARYLESVNQYHYSNFIIEEPEQNLFPETQRDLVYFLLEKIKDPVRDHRLTITTHSPYILYALNNCMMGHNVAESMPKVEQEELRSNPAWLDPNLVSVWEIENGTIKSIKNKETGTVNKHYFNRVMNEVMDEYYEMLNYLET